MSQQHMSQPHISQLQKGWQLSNLNEEFSVPYEKSFRSWDTCHWDTKSIENFSQMTPGFPSLLDWVITPLHWGALGSFLHLLLRSASSSSPSFSSSLFCQEPSLVWGHRRCTFWTCTTCSYANFLNWFCNFLCRKKTFCTFRTSRIFWKMLCSCSKPDANFNYILFLITVGYDK